MKVRPPKVQAQRIQPLYGGIEAGGTRFNCVLGTGSQELLAHEAIPTTLPHETIHRVIDFFSRACRDHGPLKALGIASFGPVDLHPASKTYGCITNTPKPGWSGTNLLGELQASLQVPAGFDTDVNGAALGEGLHGAARGLKNYVYVTIGTGVGAGVYANGEPIKGATHPEVGHMLVPRAQQDMGFAGNCPFHGDCLEGLVAGPALAARWGTRAELLPVDHPAWDLQAHYLAVLCMNLTLCYSPERIILGGGVMARAQLFPMIRQKFARLMNNYGACSSTADLEQYIVAPALGDASGITGALAIAERAFHQQVT